MGARNQSPPNLNQEAMRLHNLLLLLHLPIRCARGNKPLIDYFQSHVVTSSEYPNIFKKKTMNKVVIKEIREGKKRKRG
jgi:hypothetical protein